MQLAAAAYTSYENGREGCGDYILNSYVLPSMFYLV